MHMAGTARADTRRNILEVSLGLFNERSPAQVTTAEIAASAGVAEGNLHYHFRRKADRHVRAGGHRGGCFRT